MSRKNRGLRLHTFGMRLAFYDFYESEKCVRMIFYAIRRYYIAPLRLVRIRRSPRLGFLKVANPGFITRVCSVI